MSAFAALGKKDDNRDYCYAHPLEKLLKDNVKVCNIEFNVCNSIFTPTSVVVGLLPSQYLVISGLYQLKVYRGTLLINNVHQLPCGKSFSVVTSTAESLPTLSVPEDYPNSGESDTTKKDTLPNYATLIEISNFETGIEDIGAYCPMLRGLYREPELEYSFEFVQLENNASSTVNFTSQTLRSLNGLCRNIDTVAVYGVPNSGKKTVAKTILNNVLLSGKDAVAYFDLDPGSVDANHPGCLSLRVLRKPVFGEFFFWQKSDDQEEHIHRYYGFTSFTENPALYMKLCEELFAYYRTELKPKGIPLVVKYPAWMKGSGKELLMKLSRTMNAKKTAYLTHNDAQLLENFEPDAFEETDHPDIEVMSGFQCKDYTLVKGVRRERLLPKAELLTRNKLLHFHQFNNHSFDFTKPLLHIAPVRFALDHLSAISVINNDTNQQLSDFEVFSVTEATIMAIFIVKEFTPPSEGLYLSGSAFTELDREYVALCMVHLVNIPEKSLYLYVPGNERVSDELYLAKESGYKIILARGEGEIPAVEYTNGMSGMQSPLPYVSYNQKQKFDGIWRTRRNIKRKNQG